MSKMSELDRLVRELKKCGESLVGISEELAEVLSGPGNAGKEGGGSAAKKGTVKKEEKAVEQEAEQEKEYSLTEVRALLAEKSRAGHTAEVRALLLKHGADKLSGIDPAEYAALVADAEVL